MQPDIEAYLQEIEHLEESRDRKIEVIHSLWVLCQTAIDQAIAEIEAGNSRLSAVERRASTGDLPVDCIDNQKEADIAPADHASDAPPPGKDSP